MGAEPFRKGGHTHTHPRSDLQTPFFASVPELSHTKAPPVQTAPSTVPWYCCVGYWCSLAAWSVLYFTCKGTAANSLFSLTFPHHNHLGFGALKWCQCVGWLLLRMHWLSFYAPITLAPSECAVLVFLQLSVPVMCWLAPTSFVRRYRIRWIVAVRLASFVLHFAARALYLPTIAAPASQNAIKDESKIANNSDVAEPALEKSPDDECSCGKVGTQADPPLPPSLSGSIWYMGTIWQLVAPVKLPRHLLMVEFILIAIDALLHLSAGGLHASVFINTGLFNLLYGVVLPVLLASLPIAGGQACQEPIYLLAANAAEDFAKVVKNKLQAAEGYISRSWEALLFWSQATVQSGTDSNITSSSALPVSASPSPTLTHQGLLHPDSRTALLSEFSSSKAQPISDRHAAGSYGDAGGSYMDAEQHAASGSSSSSHYGKSPAWAFDYSSSGTPFRKGRLDASSGSSMPDESHLESGVQNSMQYSAEVQPSEDPLGLLYKKDAKGVLEVMEGIDYNDAAILYDELADDPTCAALPPELQQLMDKWQTLPAMEVEPLYTSCVKRTTLAVKVGHSVDEEKATNTLGDLDNEDTFIQVAAELSNNVVSALHSSLDTDSLYLSTVCVRGCVQLVLHASIPLSSFSKVAGYGGWQRVIDTQMLMEQMQQALWMGLGKTKRLGDVVISADGSAVVYQQAPGLEGNSAEVCREVVPEPVSCTFSLQSLHPMCIKSNLPCSLEVQLAVQGQGMGTSFMARAVLLNQGAVFMDCPLKLSMFEGGRVYFGWLEVPPVRCGALELWILGHGPQEAGKVYAMALLPVLSPGGAFELQKFFSTYPRSKQGKGATGSGQGSSSGVPKAKQVGGESEEWHCFGELAHDLALLLMHACGTQPSVDSSMRHLHLLTANDVAALLQKLLSWFLSQGLLLATRDCMYTCHKSQFLQKLLRQAGTDLVKVADAAMSYSAMDVQMGVEKGHKSVGDEDSHFTRCKRWLYSCCTWRTAALAVESSVCVLRCIQLYYPSITHPALLTSSTAPLLWKLAAMMMQFGMLAVMHKTRVGLGLWKKKSSWVMLVLEMVFSWVVLVHLFQPQCHLEGAGFMHWFSPLTVAWAPRALHALLFVLVHVPRFGQLALLAILTKVLLGVQVAKHMCPAPVLGVS